MASAFDQFVLGFFRGLQKSFPTGAVRRSVVAAFLAALKGRPAVQATGEQILDALREHGAGIRTQDFYRMKRASDYSGSVGVGLSMMSPDDPITLDMYQEWENFPGSNYYYDIEAPFTNYDNPDEFNDKILRIASDDRIDSVSLLRQYIEENIGREWLSKGLKSFEDIRLIGAWRVID